MYLNIDEYWWFVQCGRYRSCIRLFLTLLILNKSRNDRYLDRGLHTSTTKWTGSKWPEAVILIQETPKSSYFVCRRELLPFLTVVPCVFLGLVARWTPTPLAHEDDVYGDMAGWNPLVPRRHGPGSLRATSRKEALRESLLDQKSSTKSLESRSLSWLGFFFLSKCRFQVFNLLLNYTYGPVRSFEENNLQ